MEIPTLLIHGRDDRVVHYESTLLLLAHIPNSRAVLLNRCGHWAQVEHARRTEWASEVDDVLRRRTTVMVRGLDSPEVRSRVSELLAS